MPLTSTDASRRLRRHPIFRFGPPLLTALMAVPVGALAVRLAGGEESSGEGSASLASAVEPSAVRIDPERASRSGFRAEEPLAPETSTTTAVRVEVTRVTEERVTPIPKERRDDPALPRGETRVEADGSPGRERVVFEITRHNGRIVAKRRLSSEVITPASPRVVYVGRGGGRGAPTDDEAVPLKLRIAGAEPAGSGGGQQEGGASWYRYKPGTCAHRSLPKGTVVKVTNLGNGKSANCTVADRGPFIAGRIIDLDRSVFLAIADSPGQGVVRVRIEW
ncbi:MAG: G5 domain-containing protein [Actinomycetota bacterium]|jgi:hypothetical protein